MMMLTEILVFLLRGMPRLIPALRRLIPIEQEQPAIDPRHPPYHMVVARPDKLKYLVLLQGVTDFHHIHFNIRENSELFITAGRLVQGTFERLQLCIPLPPGGDYNNGLTETFFDQASCIFRIELSGF